MSIPHYTAYRLGRRVYRYARRRMAVAMRCAAPRNARWRDRGGPLHRYLLRLRAAPAIKNNGKLRHHPGRRVRAARHRHPGSGQQHPGLPVPRV